MPYSQMEQTVWICDVLRVVRGLDGQITMLVIALDAGKLGTRRLLLQRQMSSL
jgi:hypothetical protein